MKKTLLLMTALAAFATLQAQWVDDPATNTFIANCSDGASEIYTSTDPISGDTYVQWTTGASNGWAPWLQRLTFDGTPQWGTEGIQITTPNLASWSPGYAMTATTDGGVVSMFRTADAHHWAVRINADGTFPWGEHGIMLFDGQGGDRSEVLAGDDGGVWVLGTDLDYSYLQYVYPDGTLGPVITLGDGQVDYTFGLMLNGYGKQVLVVYEKETWAYTYYYEKEIYVACYTPEGQQVGSEVQLMNPYTMGGSYCHYVVPDGEDGGYAYMWHAGLGDAFNTYVFHFDGNGISTFGDLNGIPVHTADPMNFYHSAYGSADPVSHDLIIAYEQVDATTQSQSRVYVNRITPMGERIWGEGILVADYVGSTYSDIMVDAFEDGSGFSVIFTKSSESNPYFLTVEAVGMDMDGNQIWAKTLSTSLNRKVMCDNSTGFHFGQNVVTWVDGTNSGLYGQNLGTDGSMGPIEIPETCLAPENFQGQYVYDGETQTFGSLLTWEAPETQPLWYQLYITIPDGTIITAEIDPTETEYFHEMTVGATITYRLIAVYEYCDSDYALTPDGEDHITIEVTGIDENTDDEIVSIMNIYNANGQRLQVKDQNELSTGLYILQGLTQDGRLVNKKLVVNK